MKVGFCERGCCEGPPGQQAGSTHPTGMLYCFRFISFLVQSVYLKILETFQDKWVGK